MDLTLRKLIQKEQFDTIHADQLWMARYALKAKRDAITEGYHPLITLSQHNAFYLIPKRKAEATGNKFLITVINREA